MRTFIRFLVFTFIFVVNLPAAAFTAENVPAGFIVLSENKMNWSDAKAFCQQQGRRLPLINGSDSWTWKERNKITHIDNFGIPGTPWPSDLPGDYYWTGTVRSTSSVPAPHGSSSPTTAWSTSAKSPRPTASACSVFQSDCDTSQSIYNHVEQKRKKLPKELVCQFHASFFRTIK